MKEPESPGKVIPETPIIPQAKTNHKLSFSLAGFIKLMAIPNPIPIAIEMTFCVRQSLKSFEI